MILKLILILMSLWEPLPRCWDTLTTGPMVIHAEGGIAVGGGPLTRWVTPLSACEGTPITIEFTADVRGFYLELTTLNPDLEFCPIAVCFFAPNKWGAYSIADQACMSGAVAPVHQYIGAEGWPPGLRLTHCVLYNTRDIYFGNLWMETPQ